MVVVPRQGEAALIISALELTFDMIQEVSWIKDMRIVSSPDPRSIAGAYDTSVGGEDAYREVRNFGQEAQHILETNDCGDRPVGLAGLEAMPFLLHASLKSALENGITDVPDIVADLRAVKSPEEILLLRKTAQISDSAYESMLGVLEEGVWGYEVTAQMDLKAKQSGADLVYHCMHSVPGGDLGLGKLSIKSHDVRLHQGDYINVNAYNVYKGYWIQSDRSGTIGPSLGSTAGKALDANLKVQDEVLTTIRPGLPIGELVRIAEDRRQTFRLRPARRADWSWPRPGLCGRAVHD